MKRRLAVVLFPLITDPACDGTKAANTTARVPYQIEPIVNGPFIVEPRDKRNKFTAAYQSGRVTSDKLAIPLPPQEGMYYVVFSNRFSPISNKAVVADIVLHCDKGKKQAPARTAY